MSALINVSLFIKSGLISMCHPGLLSMGRIERRITKGQEVRVLSDKGGERQKAFYLWECLSISQNVA